MIIIKKPNGLLKTILSISDTSYAHHNLEFFQGHRLEVFTKKRTTRAQFAC